MPKPDAAAALVLGAFLAAATLSYYDLATLPGALLMLSGLAAMAYANPLAEAIVRMREGKSRIRPLTCRLWGFGILMMGLVLFAGWYVTE